MEISELTRKSYENTYKKGYNKEFPSLGYSKIQKIFIKKKGKLLDFGCGPGTNGLFFIQKDFHVTFCDIADFALKNLKKKLNKLNIPKSKYNLINLHKEPRYFDSKIRYFNYVICMSVFNNLGNKHNAIRYLELFNKVLKKNGKLIIDANLKGDHNYKRHKTKKGLYSTIPKNNFYLQMFFPKLSTFINIVNQTGFKINDIGKSMFKLFDTYENETIISATKKKN